VSGQVASHKRRLLRDHGISVTSSGRFISARLSPSGSLIAGTAALCNDNVVQEVVSNMTPCTSFTGKPVSSEFVHQDPTHTLVR